MREWIESLASSSPTPGGGAAGALVGAVAVALAEMVGQLTEGRPKFRDVDVEVRRILTALVGWRGELLALVDEDAVAYQQVSAAYGLPRSTEEERTAREAVTQRALVIAMEPPQRVATAALAVLRLVREMADLWNPTVASDVGCAALLAGAAVQCAGLNVLANVVLLRDAEVAAKARAEQDAREAAAAPLVQATLEVVHRRMGA
jgi:formiminotetrahydrofolate cyclodeaminase